MTDKLVDARKLIRMEAQVIAYRRELRQVRISRDRWKRLAMQSGAKRKAKT